MEDFDPVFDGYDEFRDDLAGDVSIQPWQGETAAPSTQTVYRDGKLVTISSGAPSLSKMQADLEAAEKMLAQSEKEASQASASEYNNFMSQYGQFLTRSESDLANRIFFSENPSEADISAFNALYDRLTGANVVPLKASSVVSVPQGETGLHVDATHRGGETSPISNVPFYDGTQSPGTDVFVPGYGVVRAEEAANLGVTIPGVGRMTAFEAARKGLLPRASGMNQPKSKIGTYLVLALIAFFAWRAYKKGAVQ